MEQRPLHPAVPSMLLGLGWQGIDRVRSGTPCDLSPRPFHRTIAVMLPSVRFSIFVRSKTAHLSGPAAQKSQKAQQNRGFRVWHAHCPKLADREISDRKAASPRVRQTDVIPWCGVDAMRCCVAWDCPATWPNIRLRFSVHALLIGVGYSTRRQYAKRNPCATCFRIVVCRAGVNSPE